MCCFPFHLIIEWASGNTSTPRALYGPSTGIYGRDRDTESPGIYIKAAKITWQICERVVKNLNIAQCGTPSISFQLIFPVTIETNFSSSKLSKSKQSQLEFFFRSAIRPVSGDIYLTLFIIVHRPISCEFLLKWMRKTRCNAPAYRRLCIFRTVPGKFPLKTRMKVRCWRMNLTSNSEVSSSVQCVRTLFFQFSIDFWIYCLLSSLHFVQFRNAYILWEVPVWIVRNTQPGTMAKLTSKYVGLDTFCLSHVQLKYSMKTDI